MTGEWAQLIFFQYAQPFFAFSSRCGQGENPLVEKLINDYVGSVHQ